MHGWSLDGVDNGCHIVAAAEKPKRPYPDPSVLLATFTFKLFLSNPTSYARLLSNPTSYARLLSNPDPTSYPT